MSRRLFSTAIPRTASQTLYASGTFLNKRLDHLTKVDFNELLFSAGLSQDVIAGGIHITNIACGWGHALVSYTTKLIPRSHILGIGCNSSGQLGADYTSHEMVPAMVSLDKNIGSVVDLKCGRESSYAIICNGNNRYLYTWGNCMHGQLGLAMNKNPEKAEMVIVSSPQPCTSDVSLLAVGLDHAVITKSDGIIYTCGWGPDGQLGNGDTRDRNVFTKTRYNGGKVVKLSSSTDFTLALEENGDVYSWGNNEYGQCMLDSKEDRIILPTKIPIEGITDIAAGGMFALFLKDDGVYVCGYGALGLGKDIISTSIPRKLSLPEEVCKGDMRIFATTDYAMIVCSIPNSSHSRMFVFGLDSAKTGRLGVTSTNKHDETYFEPIEIKTQEYPNLNAQVNIKDVALGGMAMLVLEESG